jgi:hypothetical protein
MKSPTTLKQRVRTICTESWSCEELLNIDRLTCWGQAAQGAQSSVYHFQQQQLSSCRVMQIHSVFLLFSVSDFPIELWLSFFKT